MEPRKWGKETINEVLEALKTEDIRAIADRLSTTPDAIRMALRRNGISYAAYVGAIRAMKRRAERRARLAKPSLPKIPPNDGSVMDAIERLEGDQCRWLVNAVPDGNVTYCCAPIAVGNYCAVHYARVHL